VAEQITRRVAGRHVLLLTDFDGTLADLAPTPAEAALSDAVARSIVLLAGRPGVTFGVVSGRRLLDVAARVGPAAEYVAGLHGLEIRGPGVSFHHSALDVVEPIIRVIKEDAAKQLAWCPGVHLEDKTYALTCHVRLSPPALGDLALEQFEAVAEPHLEGQELKLLTGARALELLPAVDWHKGRAAAWIRARVAARVSGAVSIVYLGDDRTDEDAFDGLGSEDVAVGVGDRPHTHLIDYRLAGPASVGRLFQKLAGLRT
jgi:trehalose-phosphatase